MPERLDLSPFIIALQVRHGTDGGAVLINPGISLLATPGLPRTMSFVAAFSLVVQGTEIGRHRIRLEVKGPGGVLAGANENDYWVAEAWTSASERARLVTIPVQVELTRHGGYEFHLLLDGRAAGPAWPLWVTGG